MSYIHYKFKAAKDYDSVVVDGMGMAVFDLKREIITQKKLKGDDFDLVLSNAESNEEYVDDTSLVPRNSSVLIRRIPIPDAKKRGIVAGASKYLGSDAPMPSTATTGGASDTHVRPKYPPFAPRVRPGANATASTDGVVPLLPVQSSQYPINSINNGIPGLSHGGASASSSSAASVGIPGLDRLQGAGDGGGEMDAQFGGAVGGMADDDLFKLQAALQENSEYWQATQEKMASMRKIHNRPMQPGMRPGMRPRPRPDGLPPREPPPGYLCHRCGQKGHYIQDCPTNGDTTFDRPKVKRTTGIPRSFLREVEDPMASMQNRGTEAAGAGVMLTKDGRVVQVMSNEAAWKKIQSTMVNAVSNEEMLMEQAPVLPEYACTLCHKTMKEAVEISCIRTSLTEDGPMQFTCPECHKHPMIPDNLQPNTALRSAIEQYLREYISKRLREERERPESGTQSPMPADGATTGSSSSAAAVAGHKVGTAAPTLESRITERSGGAGAPAAGAVSSAAASMVRLHAPIGRPPGAPMVPPPHMSLPGYQPQYHPPPHMAPGHYYPNGYPAPPPPHMYAPQGYLPPNYPPPMLRPGGALPARPPYYRGYPPHGPPPGHMYGARPLPGRPPGAMPAMNNGGGIQRPPLLAPGDQPPPHTAAGQKRSASPNDGREDSAKRVALN
ncbi:Protein mpe1 [Sorochytrium milnesiophthora]